MPSFMIERDVPGFGSLSTEELKSVSQQSNAVLREMRPTVRWIHSYVTADKLYCIYHAPHAEAVREHARRGNFPITRIEAITTVIDPTTANGPVRC